MADERVYGNVTNLPKMQDSLPLDSIAVDRVSTGGHLELADLLVPVASPAVGTNAGKSYALLGAAGGAVDSSVSGSLLINLSGTTATSTVPAGASGSITIGKGITAAAESVSIRGLTAAGGLVAGVSSTSINGTATSSYATALGRNSLASNTSSVAIGSQSIGNTTASGLRSIAIGSLPAAGAVASGVNAIALGGSAGQDYTLATGGAVTSIAGQQIHGTSLALANYQVTKSVIQTAATAATYPLVVLGCDAAFTEYGVYTGTVYISIAEVGSDLCAMFTYPLAVLSGNSPATIKSPSAPAGITQLFNNIVAGAITTTDMMPVISTGTGADAGTAAGNVIIRVPRVGSNPRRIIVSFVGNKVAMD